MIDCDKSIEGKGLRKVVKRKKSVERERIGRKEEEIDGCENFFIACASFG